MAKIIQKIEYLAPVQKASKRRLAELTIELTVDIFKHSVLQTFFKMKSRHLAATGYNFSKKALSTCVSREKEPYYVF